jgi:PEP-CTERM motif-containing protein
MMRRILATSLVWLCLLTAPVLPALAQNSQGQNGNNQGQNGQRRTTVPEPSATLLVVLGLGGVGALEWRRRVRGAAKRQSS